MQLVGGVVGATVGFFIGGPVGAQLGFAVGSSLAAPTQKFVGPKLTDLKVSSSEYGAPIPYIEGHPRVAGNVIWASEIRPIEQTTEQGKGGPSAETTTYVYEVDLLYLLAATPMAGLAQVFKNGKLVYTTLADADEASLDASLDSELWDEIRVYTGADDQLPDPDIEAVEGVGNVPAYRNRFCVFIKSLQLGPSSQLPNLTFVPTGVLGDQLAANAVRYAQDVAQTREHGANLRPYGAHVLTGDSRLAVLSTSHHGVLTYTVDEFGIETLIASDDVPAGFQESPGSGNGSTAIVVFDTMDTGRAGFYMAGDGVSQAVELPNPGNQLGGTALRFATHGTRVAVSTAAAIGYGADPDEDTVLTGNQGRIYIYSLAGELLHNIDAGLVVSCLALSGTTLWALSSGTVYPYTEVDGVMTLGATFAVAAGGTPELFVSTGGELHCVNADGEVYRRRSGEWTLLTTLDDGAGTDLGSTTCKHGATASQIYVAKGVSEVVVDDTFAWLPSGLSPLDEIPPWPLSPDDPGPVAAYHLTLWADFTTVFGGDRAMRNSQWEVQDLSLTPSGGYYGSATVILSTEALYGYPGDTTGNFGFAYEDWVWGSFSANFSYRRYLLESFEWTVYRHDLYRQPFLQLSELTEPTLDEVVSRICLRTTLEASDIDVTDLATKTVKGFPMSQVSPARAFLEILAGAYYFEAVESDGVIKFVFRGGDVVATIPYADMGAGIGSPATDPLELHHANDTELPAQFSITYANNANNYLNGTEASDRLNTATAAVANISVPLVLDPDEAKGIVDTMVMDQVVATTVLRFQLGMKWAELECTDPIIATGKDGSTYRCRIVRHDDAGGVLAIEAALDDQSVLKEVGITSDLYAPQTTVLGPGETEILFLDIPLLRDVDDEPGFYVALNGTGEWPGARLYEAPDDLQFEAVVDSTNDAITGSTVGILGNWEGGAVIDEFNTVTVSTDGTLSSYTRDSVLNGTAVPYLIGDEVLYAMSATLIATNTYALSRFFRGRRGTEWAMSTHVGQERFVALTTAGLRNVTDESSDLGVERYWRAVTYGRALSSADSETFANTGVRLKPFSPVDVRFAFDAGDITITWRRRTRLSARLTGALGISIPLGEETEAYEIDVYSDDTYTDVVRTLQSSTPTVEYTLAHQITDFGSPSQATFYFGIFQISATVGRGYEARAQA